MKDVMLSLINAIRMSLPNEIKFLFHLFDLLCEKKNIKKSDIINIIFFQRFLISKCSIDNFYEVKQSKELIDQYFDEINSNVFNNVTSLIDNFVEYCSHANEVDKTRKMENTSFDKKDQNKSTRKTLPVIKINKKVFKQDEKKKFSQSTGNDTKLNNKQ